MYKQDSNKLEHTTTTTTSHKTVIVDGLSIFYRETGDPTNPKLPLTGICGSVLDEIWMTIGKIIFKYLIGRDHHDKD
jgi:hypothetical protein